MFFHVNDYQVLSYQIERENYLLSQKLAYKGLK